MDKSLKSYTISPEQIRLMHHALGISKVAPKNKRINKVWTQVIEHHRNYYDNGVGTNPYWESLLDQGLASVEIRGSNTVYSVSDEGIEFVGHMLGAKVVDKYG